MPDNYVSQDYRPPTPLQMAMPISPFQYLPTVVHPDGTINWTHFDTTTEQAFNNALSLSGQGIGGQTGVPGIKTGLGYAYDHSIKSFGQSVMANLDVNLGKAMDPNYTPPDEQKIASTKGSQYWNTNVHPMVKKALADYGLTPGNMTGQTGLQTRDRINTALKYIQMAETQKQYTDNHLRFGPSRGMRFLVVDVAASFLTDPTTLLTVGAGKGATIGAKGAVKVLQAGGTEAAKIAYKAGAKSALRQAADNTAKILWGMSHQIGTKQANDIYAKWYVRYGSSGLTNAMIGGMRANQATKQAEARKDFRPQYSQLNLGMDAGMGIFLPMALDGLLSKVKPKGIPKQDLVNQMAVRGPTLSPTMIIHDSANPLGGTAKIYAAAQKVNQIKDLFRQTGNPPDQWAHTFGSVDWIDAASNADWDHDNMMAWLRNHPTPEQIQEKVDIINHITRNQPPGVPKLPQLIYRRPGNKIDKTPTVVVPYKIANPVDHALMVLSRSVGKMGSLQKIKLLDYVRAATKLDDTKISQLVPLVSDSIKDRAVEAVKTGAKQAKVQLPVWRHFVDRLDQTNIKGVSLDKVSAAHILNNTQTDWSTTVRDEPALQKRLQSILAQTAQSEQDSKEVARIRKKLNYVAKIRQRDRSQVIGPAKAQNLPTDTGYQLAPDQAFLVLDANKNVFLPQVGTVWYNRNRADKFVKKTADYLASKGSGSGLYAIQHNQSPIVRRLGKYILTGMDMEDRNIRRTILPLQVRSEQGKMFAAMAANEHRMARIGVDFQTALSLRQRVYESLTKGTRDGAETFKDPAHYKAYEGMLNAGQKYFAQKRKEGLLSGRLRNLDTYNYLPRILKRTAAQNLSQIQKSIHENWVKGWTQPDAPVHLKTIRGILYDQTQFSAYNTAQVDSIQQIAKLTYDKLPALLKAEYTAKLKDPNGVLGTMARRAPRRSLGQATAVDRVSTEGWILSDEDVNLPDVKIDTTKARKIHDSVWDDPKVNQYLQKDVQALIAHYELTSAPMTYKAQLMKDITGRTDISWDTFMDWASTQAKDQVQGSHAKHVQEGLKQIKHKVDALSGLGRMTDQNTFKLPATALGTTQRVLTGAVNAREGVQTLATDVVGTLIFGAMHPQRLMSQISMIVKAIATGDNRMWQGMAHGTEFLRHAAMRGLSQSELPLAHSASLWEQWANYFKRVRDVATNNDPDLFNKITDITLSMADTVAMTGRAFGFGDLIHKFNKTIVYHDQATGFAKQFNQVLKASELLHKQLDAGNPITQNTWQAISRHSGINDYLLLTKMRNMGLLDKDVAAGLKALNNTDSKLISVPTTGHTGDYTKAFEALQKIPDGPQRLQAEKALMSLRGYLQQRTDSRAARPTVATMNVDPSNSVYKQIARVFTSYTNAFYEQRVKSGFMNQSKGHAMCTMGLAMLGQFIWFNVNKILYRGYTPQDIQDQLQNDPYGTMTQYALRSPLLGPFGSFMMQAQGVFGKQRPGTTAESTAVAAGRALKNIVQAGFDQNRNAKAKDWDGIARLTPITNLPYFQALHYMTGYRSNGAMITGDENYTTYKP